MFEFWTRDKPTPRVRRFLYVTTKGGWEPRIRMRLPLLERQGQQPGASAPCHRPRALPRSEHSLPSLSLCGTATVFSRARGLKLTTQITTFSSPIWRISCPHSQPTFCQPCWQNRCFLCFFLLLHIILKRTWATPSGQAGATWSADAPSVPLVFISHNISVPVRFCWHNSALIRRSRPAASLRRINVPLSSQARTSAGLELQRCKEERLLLATFRRALEKPPCDPRARQ